MERANLENARVAWVVVLVVGWLASAAWPAEARPKRKHNAPASAVERTPAPAPTPEPTEPEADAPTPSRLASPAAAPSQRRWQAKRRLPWRPSDSGRPRAYRSEFTT